MGKVEIDCPTQVADGKVKIGLPNIPRVANV